MKRIAVLLLLVTQWVFGQSEPTEKPNRFMFKLSPQHLLRNSLKFGGEFFSESKRSSLVIFLQAVSNNSERDPYPIFPYSGGGLELNYRKYIAPIQSITSRKGRQYTQGIYFSFFLQGGIYKGDYDYIETDYDFQTQIRTEEHVVYQESAKNVGTGFNLGLQQVFWNILTADVYLGAGYQLGSNSITGTKPANSFADYSSSTNSAGYTGVIPKGGILIGIYLK